MPKHLAAGQIEDFSSQGLGIIDQALAGLKAEAVRVVHDRLDRVAVSAAQIAVVVWDDPELMQPVEAEQCLASQVRRPLERLVRDESPLCTLLKKLGHRHEVVAVSAPDFVPRRAVRRADVIEYLVALLIDEQPVCFVSVQQEAAALQGLQTETGNIEGA